VKAKPTGRRLLREYVHTIMRFASLILIAGISMQAAELRVDHVTIAGTDLNAMRRMFEAAGIPTEFGGKHSNGITEMALSSFADGSYFELIAPQAGASVAAHYWGEFMTKNAGPCAWAVASKSIAQDAKRLAAANVKVEQQKSGRKRPDGVELKWETATVGPPPQGSFFPFLIWDETPRDRRVFPQGKPTTDKISGVRFVVVAVRDLGEAAGKYRAAFGLPEPRKQDDAGFGAHLAWFEGTPVVLASPIGNGWLAERLKQFGEIPCAFVLGSAGALGDANWFGNRIAWIDPAKLSGSRIALTPSR
jgi:hypothetical protein